MQTGNAQSKTCIIIMNAHGSEKLNALIKAQAEREDATAILDNLYAKIKGVDYVVVGSTITITRTSSEKQFLYALGILNNTIASCKQLNVSDKEYVESRDRIVNLWNLSKEYNEWCIYSAELGNYVDSIKRLLTNEDKFHLLNYPKSPTQK